MSESQTERRLLRTLAASFLTIAVLILAVYAFGVGAGAPLGQYLKTLANLGSLLPTALLAYHIYRYRYLELILKESLIVASFASVVLVVYLYGIRTLALWVTAQYGLRPGAVESLMILMLALVAAPLRRWLDRRFRRLFEQEAGLFRDGVARIGESAGRYGQLPELLRFVEERAAEALGLRRVRLLALASTSDNEGMNDGSLSVAGREEAGARLERNGDGANQSAAARADERQRTVDEGERVIDERERAIDERGQASVRGRLATDGRLDVRSSVAVSGEVVEEVSSDEDDEGLTWEERVLEISREDGWTPVEGSALLRGRGWEVAYPRSRAGRAVGLRLADAPPHAPTYEVRSVLELLAGQVAIAIEDERLVGENVRLERRIAHSERLAALGRMAATVAHEVKNPLSAIKSIAQVMREDSYLRRDYARDLHLIVGETDRLSPRGTQMLSFARSAPQEDAPRRADELLQTVVQLFRKEAATRSVSIKTDIGRAAVELDGACAASVRDALSNLLLNALQATPDGGHVKLAARADGEKLSLVVTDSGPGVPREYRERIWEPFFTTRQRGTGLGLAIVRKRIQEVGGEARLAPSRAGEGACFELIVPLRLQEQEAGIVGS